MKQLMALLIVLSLSVPSWAGINDVLEKQKSKEKEEIRSQQLGKAKHDRFLELFNVVAGVVEELQKKGVNFKTWPSKYLSDYEVANEFRNAGWNVNVPVKGLRRYHKDKKTTVLAGGPAPLLGSKLNDKVILFGSYLTKEREYITFGTPDTLVMIDNGEGESVSSSILAVSMMTEQTRSNPITMLLPLFEDTSLNSKRDEIKDDILKLLGGDVEALLEIQKTRERDEQGERELKVRFHEVFGVVASVVEEFQKKGVKFKSYSKDIFIFNRNGKKYTRESNCPITASKLNDKVMLRHCDFLNREEIFFKTVEGSEITIEHETDGSAHPENLIIKMYTDGTTVEMTIPIFGSNAEKKESKAIREYIFSMVESSMGQDGLTALMRAAFNGHVEMAKLLIENGADLDAKDNDGWRTSLIFAVSEGHIEMAKLLVEKGADINASDKDGCTPLRHAAANGRSEIARILIEKGADLEVKANDGHTLLMAASAGGAIELVDMLITKGADINASDRDGCTPLRYAVANDRTEIAKILIEKGADINAKDNKDVTPLKRAIEKNHKAMVKLLRSNGAKE